MRFIMITTVAASVAVAMGAVLASGNEPAHLCNSGTASNPVCCSTDVLGLADLDCATREFSLLKSKEITYPHYSTYSRAYPT